MLQRAGVQDIGQCNPVALILVTQTWWSDLQSLETFFSSYNTCRDLRLYPLIDILAPGSSGPQHKVPAPS